MKYRKLKGYKYQTVRDYACILPELATVNANHADLITLNNGKLVIKNHYCWNGASGPTFDTRATMIPSLVHDALYQLLALGLLPSHYRTEADAILYRLLNGTTRWSKFRASYYHTAVTLFGSFAIHQKATEPQDEIYTIFK